MAKVHSSNVDDWCLNVSRMGNARSSVAHVDAERLQDHSWEAILNENFNKKTDKAYKIQDLDKDLNVTKMVVIR
jgi:hypothetical protein